MNTLVCKNCGSDDIEYKDYTGDTLFDTCLGCYDQITESPDALTEICNNKKSEIIMFLEEILSSEEELHAYAVGHECRHKSKAYAVALLHDIVEDGYATFEELQQRFDLNAEQIDALKAITRRNEERYFDYIQRVKQNRIAKIVKLADLQDNISRCAKDLPNRWGLIRRYAKAYGILIDEWEGAE